MNVALNAKLIPIIGIPSAAVATLATITPPNAILARCVLAQMITLYVEHSSLLNILKVWLALVPVVLGGVVYGVLILKFDRKIYEELKGIIMQMNVAWPEWL